MTIEIYMVHNQEDREWSGPYTDFLDAKEIAIEYAAVNRQPYAVIAQTFEYSDSELAWTTNDSDTWPPTKETT